MGLEEADHGVEFVDCAVGADAGGVFGDAGAVDERGHAAVACAGVEGAFFHVGVGFFGCFCFEWQIS